MALRYERRNSKSGITWKKLLKRGWHCVDVGANRGDYTFLMAKLVGASGFVDAFELHPDNARMARCNTARFCDRRNVENLAITDGTKPLVDVFHGKDKSNAEWNIVGPHHGTGKAEFSIHAISLDQYFDKGCSTSNFVKIDVEGAGEEVLVGMERILKQSRPILVFEVHSPKEWESRKHLHDAGYRIGHWRSNQSMGKAAIFPFHCTAIPK